MFLAKRTLTVKITAILVSFFLVALAAIGLTLYISWQLEGASAAVSDAGSLRMRTYRIAHQLAHPPADASAGTPYNARLSREIAQIDAILGDLVHGNPERPLYIPRDSGIPDDVASLATLWQQRIRPTLVRYVGQPAMVGEHAGNFDSIAEDFVSRINGTVVKMEVSYEKSIRALRTFQFLLILLAVIGTIVLLRFFLALVVRPVATLGEGLRRISEEDFTMRVPVHSHDEFGKLAAGFNTMAGHLEGLYTTLEQRVDEKTRTLTAKNHELEILYSIGAFLRAPTDIDSLCRGFLDRVRIAMGASAGSVRLLDAGSENLCITVDSGIDKAFRDREAVLPCSECLCGQTATRNATVVADVAQAGPGMTLDTCRRAGYQGIAAASISVGKKSVGVFNLFFKQPHALAESERKLLETLGQQLGSAIDNLRLQARDRELAVSEERNHMARELHDSIAQGLAFLNIQLQMLEKALARDDHAQTRTTLELIRQGVQESYDDVRELLVHFRARIDTQDLDSAIGAALRHVAGHAGVATELEVEGGGAPLDSETETQVLYIVQEALSNIRKHARAKSIKISLRRGFDGLSVIVRDDGVGFKHRTVKRDSDGGHIGLQIMQERAARIGGYISVRSSRNKGTEIRFDLPRQNIEVA